MSTGTEQATTIHGSSPAPEVARPRSLGLASRLPWFPLAVLVIFVFVAVFAPLLTSYDPLGMSLPERLKPPSHLHPLGTDTLGRDVLARLFYGARISLIVAASAVVTSGLIGLAIGIASGYLGGAVDAVLMRLTDCFMALPTLLISLVFVMAVGPGLTTVVIALSIVGWSRFARIIRSEVLSIRERDFVALAKIGGAGQVRIMVRHVLPNVFNTFMVITSLEVSGCVLSEAMLSFLGAGVPTPTPTWGNMISDGMPYVSTAWWLMVFPGLALLLIVYSMNLFGDWLRDFLDPKLKQG
ncbi:MAG TPA: ABC transporter permease [Devosia sp.]|nr:ABC transporter permease [Devosia sp.]